MTAPRMIYVVGQPGSGKSTLVARLTQRFTRVSVDTPVPHDVLFDPVTGAEFGAEIGRRRELFSGTDALASSIISRAVPWIESSPYRVVLAEGARLGNERFIRAATTGYHVHLVLLDHAEAETWRKARAKKIGKAQNPSWVKGRLSASRNLADKMEGNEDVTVHRGDPESVLPAVLALMVD